MIEVPIDQFEWFSEKLLESIKAGELYEISEVLSNHYKDMQHLNHQFIYVLGMNEEWCSATHALCMKDGLYNLAKRCAVVNGWEIE